MFYEGLMDLHKPCWGTTKKHEKKKFKLIFFLRPTLGREGLTEVKRHVKIIIYD